jgi:hypothetical protein
MPYPPDTFELHEHHRPMEVEMNIGDPRSQGYFKCFKIDVQQPIQKKMFLENYPWWQNGQ